MRCALWAASCAVLCVAAASGCASSTIRGQSPEVRTAIKDPHVTPAGHARYHAKGAWIDDGSGGGMGCPPQYTGIKQLYRYDYQVPQNLSYPDPNQMPAVVQYPYYTVRGPTDFFYQGD